MRDGWARRREGTDRKSDCRRRREEEEEKEEKKPFWSSEGADGGQCVCARVCVQVEHGRALEEPR